FCDFKWANWQSISSFLGNVLETNKSIKKQERDFTLDLYNLLDKKNLRDFQSFDALHNIKLTPNTYPFIFLNAKEVKFRGNFVGFLNCMAFDKKMESKMDEFLFFERKNFTFYGVFMGFTSSLLFKRELEKNREKRFLDKKRKKCEHLLHVTRLFKTGNRIFYKKDDNYANEE
ncbi:hypothetical protein ACFL0Q_07880, partial [Thermodesulfobacteriota bacterium]